MRSFMKSGAMLWLIATAAAGCARSGPGAQLIFTNGAVYTVTEQTPWAEAIAVGDGRILAVGTNDEVARFARRHTVHVDLDGRMLLPGFHDARLELLRGANTLASTDLSDCTSLGEIRDQLAIADARLRPTEWLIAAGGHRDLIFQQRQAYGPTGLDIDRFERPTLLVSADGRLGWLNSIAIEDLRDRGMELPASTVVSGVLARQESVNQVIRAVMPTDRHARQSRLENAVAHLHRFGITSVSDVGPEADAVRAQYRELIDPGRWPLRLNRAPGMWVAESETLSTGTARRNTSVLRRHRIDGTSSAIYGKMPRLGPPPLVALVYPGERESSTSQLAVSQAGSPGWEWFRLQLGARILFGSDWPARSVDPMVGIHTAITGEDLDGNPATGSSDNLASLESAIEAYTLAGAYGSFNESRLGSLAVGKLADLAVLSENIFQIPPQRIPEVRTELTLIHGRFVYIAEGVLRGDEISELTHAGLIAGATAIDRQASATR